MLRRFTPFVVFASCLAEPALVHAQTAALLAATDPTQIAEVLVAKVMADDSSSWLSVRLKGRTRLAFVTSRSAVVATPSAEAWLRALDFTTRMRVAPPAGPLPECGTSGELRLADSGLPEAASLTAQRVWDSDSELDLRRSLADAGLTPDLTRLAHFTDHATPPFRVSLYESPATGGMTAALRFSDLGHALDVPSVDVSGLPSVPLSVIALAPNGVLPLEDSADPSEFAVTYRGANATTDYVAARAAWRAENPGRWLSEAQATSALFAWTVFPAHGQIAPVSARYFQALPTGRAAACEQKLEAAHAQGSMTLADYVCDGSDDLAIGLRELDFGEARLSRLFGSSSERGAKLHFVVGDARNPRLLATDFDARNCPTATPVAPMTPIATGNEMTLPFPHPHPSSREDETVDDSGYYAASEPAYDSDGSCNVGVFGSSSHDSCSGDGTSDSSTRDSCSGDSSSGVADTDDSCSGDSSTNDSSSDDSCNGHGSSDDSGPDSCSGDSSHSSSDDSCSGSSDSGSDSSGCGKSDYDGDTCSGSSSSSNADHAERSSSAALGTQKGSAGHRPRPVRLSLLTLLAAALALPLRRLRAWR